MNKNTYHSTLNFWGKTLEFSKSHLFGRPLCTLAEALERTVSGLVNLRGWGVA